MTAAPYLWEAFEKIVAKLADAGVHRPSDWWMVQHRESYLHPTAKIDCWRVGRGGDKSRNLKLRTVVNLIAGRYNIPTGERHWHVGFSNRLDECMQAISQLSEWFDILDVSHRVKDDQIFLTDLPVGFWALPCSNKAARGPRAIGGYADELASWSVNGANPAEEVGNSMMAMGITHPEARFDFASSPMSHLDYHAKLFERGNTEHQRVAWAPSWVANPGGITEAACMSAAGGQQRTFDMEYRAIPQSPTAVAVPEEDIAALTPGLIGDATALGTPKGLYDDSGVGNDATTFGQCQWLSVRGCIEDERWMMVHAYNAKGEIIHRNASYVRDKAGRLIPNPKWTEERRVLYVSNLVAFEGATTRHMSSEEKLRQVAERAHIGGVRQCFGDKYSQHYTVPLFRRHGIEYEALDWTNTSKAIAVARLRALMRERSIIVQAGPEAEKLKDELRNFQEKITASGTVKYEGKSGKHDDRVALLLNAAMLDIDGKLSGSPIQQFGGRTDYSDEDFSRG